MDFGLCAAHAEGLTEMSRSPRPKGRTNRVSAAFPSSSFAFNDLPVPRTLAKLAHALHYSLAKWL